MTQPLAVDVIVLGMGPGGEVAAARLLAAGKRVAVVERELIGGECAYWACIPSKTLLRPPEAKSEATRAAGVATPRLDWPQVAAYRDWMTRHLDDRAQVRSYQQKGALVVRGSQPRRAARLAELGLADLGAYLRARHVAQGWSVRRMRAELGVSRRWLVGELARLRLRS